MTKTKHTYSSLRTALLAGAALLAAGSAHAQLTDDIVKIGVLTDGSGVYADVGGQGSLEAVKMAIADFGGTVLGKPIETAFADHQNKADIAASIARKWVDADKVDVITDLLNSAVSLAVQEIGKEKNKVILHNGAASSDLSGKACAVTGVHYTYDTYALANGTGKATVKQGGDTWFFLTADYAFGQALERDTTAAVIASGGKVLGGVRHPLSNADFSSFLLQAQASKAKVIGLANAGLDTVQTIKQAAEFGITQGGQRLGGMLIFITDVHSLGLQTAQGLTLTTGFYWDLNDETRAFSKRFFDKMKRMPTMVQAGVYSSALHYLKAVQAAGTDDGTKVAMKMRELPINDMFAKNGKIRTDGRMVHDMYLAQVKTPAESKAPWDYYKILATIPGDEAFRPEKDGGCPLVK
jgi:branched-chain amino acid transport system substrate-binding protein